MRHYDVCWQSLLLNWQTARVDVDRALQDLGPRLRGFRQQAELTLAELEHQAILRAARASKGQVSQMARQLGISRTTLWRRLKLLDIDPADYHH